MDKATRENLEHIFTAGLAAVAPDGALLRHLRLEGDTLAAGERRYDLRRRIVVLGAGKGAAPMAAALENLLGERISEGFAVVKYGHGLPLRRIRLAEAAHPVPDASGVAAARTLLDMARRAGRDDLVICLLTGGASALTPAPAPGLTLEHLQAVTALLLECGAVIDELNAVRKHLSVFSGGQLARAAGPAPVLSVIVSDVVGDNLDVIASGPTAPDGSDFAACAAIIAKFGLEARLPAPVRAHLAAGLGGHLPETPKAADPLFGRVQNLLAATNRQALEAAAAKAAALGYAPRILTDAMTGEARQRARELAEEARRAADSLRPGDAPICLLAGGETTVTIRGAGKGGRNQEMALAAGLALEGDVRVSALFAGTDGTDGPTDAAGGFASGDSAAAVRRAGASPEALLDDNASNAALRLSGDLLVTGPTRTNVMDMAVLLARPA